ncbi:hypothetical protein Trydic_g8110 [Trypoxylus dichotomus]
MARKFLADVNTVCFLVLCQYTQHEYCGNAMDIFLQDGTISISSAISQSNGDFGESNHELHSYECRLWTSNAIYFDQTIYHDYITQNTEFG